MRIAVIGAGSWGVALANLLNANGHDVAIWDSLPVIRSSLQSSRTLPGGRSEFVLAPEIETCEQCADALRDSELVLFAVPSQYLRSVLIQVKPSIPFSAGLLNAAKGVEVGTLLRMSQVIQEVLVQEHQRIATLSGPSHAEEVIRGIPTAVVIAGTSQPFVKETQELFMSPTFRVYEGDDLIGVELGGSMKNIIAIAVGVADGLGMGDNTRGAIITRGLAEMTRLAVAMGARAETFSGLSGLGDLVTTCTSRHSRNRAVGEKIGRGDSLQTVLSGMTMIAEGVDTTRAVLELASLHGIEMPITAQVAAVLFHSVPPTDAVAELMGRTPKPEVWA